MTNRPHVVILGAGASLAALPKGDRFGRKLPLMADFVATLGLDQLRETKGLLNRTENFEVQYSKLVEDSDFAAVGAVNRAVTQYFASLELPLEATLYDHLVLSLRPKDVVATFNWDPFLVQAIRRNYGSMRVNPPQAYFLHGCTDIGYCASHRPMQMQLNGTACVTCGKRVTPTRLLYPVTQKGYNSDPFGSQCWTAVQDALSRAYLFTVFGYSAPTSDAEAIELLKKGWGSPQQRNLEEVEIIDIKTEKELCEKWHPFIHTHHYGTMNSLEHSLLWRHPRRSCEAFWGMSQMVTPVQENSPPKSDRLDIVRDWYVDLSRDEATE